MIPDCPADVIGAEAANLRRLTVELVQKRHALAAEAHAVSGSRYQMGYGSLWRDLLDDFHEALKSLGFSTYNLTPGGHKIPIVNNCLVYAWRVPNDPNAVPKFAFSPTRRSAFTAPPPQPALWEPTLSDGVNLVAESSHQDEIQVALREVDKNMPVVLVMVTSTPQQLQSIEWAIAVLDDNGEVALHGRESIWEMDPVISGETMHVEAFDSGSPVTPKIELRADQSTGRNA